MLTIIITLNCFFSAFVLISPAQMVFKAYEKTYTLKSTNVYNSLTLLTDLTTEMEVLMMMKRGRKKPNEKRKRL